MGHRPIIPIVIDGIPFAALLDTGSQVTTIQLPQYERYWKQDQLTKTSSKELNIVASNGQVVPQVGCWEATVKIGNTELPQQGLIVVNVGDGDFPPVVVGMNVLQNCFTEVIEIMSDAMRVAPSSEKPMIQKTLRILSGHQRFTGPDGEVGQARISSAKPVKLRPRTETIVWCKARLGPQGQDYEVLIEPTELKPDTVTVAARSLSKVVQGRVPVRIMNCSYQMVTLRRYTSVAKLYRVYDQDIIQPTEPVFQCASQVEVCPEPEPKTEWWQELHIGTEDTPIAQKEGALRVAKEYQHIFSKFPLDFGRVEGIEHTIPTGNNPPIREKYRPIPPSMYQPVKKMIQEMKDLNVIQDSHSPWAAPLVLVKKKDGTIRLCVDYRKLNSITHKDAYPLPRIEESLTAMKSAAYFSTLDLTSGYWQIPMAPEDREKTAFTTPMGLFEFNSMAFGLCNAPGTFQRFMECCLGHKNFETVLLYLDDVIIYSKTYEEHLQHLAEVFEILAKHGLKVKPSKCHLLKSKVQYLGHVVSAEGVAPDPDKLAAVKDWPVPTTIQEVRRFLGFAGYYRRFIKNFTRIAAPLQDLLKGQQCKKTFRSPSIQWTAELENSFTQLKKMLTEAPILAYPDYNLPFHLYTDASNMGLGAVLAQVQGGQERVIAYASRSLRPTERNDQNYSSFKLELLALVWAVTDKFKHYLAATPFVAFTDNNPLSHLQTARLGAMEQRWASRLANYQFTLKYRSGKSNVNADALSRLTPAAVPDPVEDEWEEIEMPAFYSYTKLQSTQSIRFPTDQDQNQSTNCPSLENIDWKAIQKGNRTLRVLYTLLASNNQHLSQDHHNDPELKSLWRQRKRLFNSKGLLVRRTLNPRTHERILQIIVPKQDASLILEAYHDQSGHFGCQKTEMTIRDRFYWIGMREAIEQWCRKCIYCTLSRREGTEQRAPLHPIKSHRPLELVALDHVKLQPSKSGHTYALTMVDHYTKFAVVVPVKDMTAKTTAEVFWKNFVRPYGYPEQILTDQGPAFESDLFQELCSLYGCKKIRTTAYHPQCNGLCERMNKTIIDMLKNVPQQQRSNWPDLLQEITYLYNNTTQCSTGYTPYYLMFGRQGKLPADVKLNLPNEDTQHPLPHSDWVIDHQKRMNEANEIVENRMKLVHQRQEDNFNSNAKAKPLQIGDRVWKKKNHRTSKLDDQWELIPYTIQAIPFPEVYKIIRDTDQQEKVVHRNQIKPCLAEGIPELEIVVPPLQEQEEVEPREQEVAPMFPFSGSYVPCMTFLVPQPVQREEELPAEATPVLRRSERITKSRLPVRFRE